MKGRGEAQGQAEKEDQEKENRGIKDEQTGWIMGRGTKKN